MPPAGVETTILIARVGHASAQAVSEAAIVRHAIAAAQILADVRTSASPFSLCHWAAGSHRNEVSHGQRGGSRNQNIVSRVKWSRPTPRPTVLRSIITFMLPNSDSAKRQV